MIYTMNIINPVVILYNYILYNYNNYKKIKNREEQVEFALNEVEKLLAVRRGLSSALACYTEKDLLNSYSLNTCLAIQKDIANVDKEILHLSKVVQNSLEHIKLMKK